MKGLIIKDWSKVDFSTPEGRAKFTGAMNHYFQSPDTNPKFRAALQEFASSGDFPADVKDLLNVFYATANFDLGYEQIFDIRDYTQTEKSGFRIIGVENGLSFTKKAPGEKLQVKKISGNQVEVPFDSYGDALNWDNNLFADKDYLTLEKLAQEFTAAYYRDRGGAFYGLIEAVSSSRNLAWQGSSGDSVIERDIQTFNAAATKVFTDLKGTGAPINGNTPLILLTPLALQARVVQALSAMVNQVAGSRTKVAFAVTPLYTLGMEGATETYMIYPKHKAMGGYRQALTFKSAEDILANATTAAGWGRFAGALGEEKQVVRCLMS